MKELDLTRHRRYPELLVEKVQNSTEGVKKGIRVSRSR